MQGLNTNNKSKPMLVLYASDIMLSLLIHAGPEDLQTSTGVRDAWRVIRWDSSAPGGNWCSLPQVGDQDFRLMPIVFLGFFFWGGGHTSTLGLFGVLDYGILSTYCCLWL